jgi:hypothetical protein
MRAKKFAKRKDENSRLRLSDHAAIEGRRIENAAKSILHIVVQVNSVRRAGTVIISTARAAGIAAGRSRIRRIHAGTRGN